MRVLKPPQRRSLVLALSAWCLLVLLYLLPATRGWINDVDVLALGWRYLARGVVQPAPELRLVGITENTIQAFSDCGIRYSFPREWHALALKRLADAGAKIVVVDILFSDPRSDREDGALRDAIAYCRSRGCTVVLAAGIEDIQYSGSIASHSLVTPSPTIMQAQPALGISNTQPKLSYKLIEYMQYSMSASADGAPQVYHPQAVEAYKIYCGHAGKEFPGFREAPFFRINYCGPPGQLEGLLYHFEMLFPGLFAGDPGRALSRAESAALHSVFDGAYVFIGSRAKADNDYFSTPYGQMYGVDTNAQAFDTLLRERFVRAVPPLGLLGLALLLALCAWALAELRPLLRSVTGGVVVLLLLFAGSILVFVAAAVDVSQTMLIAGFALPFVACALYGGLSEEAAKQRIRGTFSKYVSEQIVEQIIADPSLADLGGSERTVAVLFNDIRNYSTLTEHLTPHQVVALLNIYFGEVTEVIRAHRGFVDKYLGDGLMAFFGGPVPTADPAGDALAAALQMVQALHERVLPRLAGAGLPALKAGIGIHVGKVVMGNIGSEARMDYTVIGDAVNVASRVEGQTKEFGCAVIATRETLELATGGFTSELLGERLVKGREQPVVLYRVFDPAQPDKFKL